MSRFFRMLLVVAALWTALLPALAEEAYTDRDLIDYGYREAMCEFEDAPVFAVRAYYELSLPEDASELPETVLEAYAGYDRILLIEYGRYELTPILQSRFVCVGASGGGEFSLLPTPFELLARTYDAEALSRLDIRRASVRAPQKFPEKFSGEVGISASVANGAAKSAACIPACALFCSPRFPAL